MSQDAGALEYHVPAEFTKARPPINYTHTIENMSISQHPIGSKIPKANGKLECFDKTGHFRILTPAQNSTTMLRDWIHTDKAQLGLHITNFDDATLVTVVWLHTLLDAMGRRALLTAWQTVLEGREDEVPDFIGYDSNPLKDLGGPKDQTAFKEDFVLKDKRLTTLGMARFVFNYVWELFWYPDEAGCLVVMPASYFAKIKSEAYKDLESLPSSELTYNNLSSGSDAKAKPFISDGDITTAWHMRLLVRTNPNIYNSYPSRLMTVMNVFGMRDLLRSTSPPASKRVSLSLRQQRPC